MNTRRNWIFALLAAVMLFALAFAAVPAKASDGTWNVNVVHGINGRSLGLSKDLPVNVTVYKDGVVLAYLNDFTFKERFAAALPAGEYKIEVFSQELGTIVPSMTIGPVMIPAGADLLIRAQLSGGKTPILNVIAK
jgi:hypothetical protein